MLKKFNSNGYCIIDLFTPSKIDLIKKILINRIKKLEKNKQTILLTPNNIKNYHKLDIVDKKHNIICKPSTRYINLSKKINDKVLSNQQIKSIIFSSWGHSKAMIFWCGNLKKNQMKKNVVGFRISRPENHKKNAKPRTDATGIHCDLHVGGKICTDKNSLISMWVPLVGFNKKYTLNLAPKSHLKDHPFKDFSKSKTVSKLFKNNYNKKFKFIRPNLKPGQAIVFHNNILHGNSFNLGSNTRVSIEIRIYNIKNMKYWLPKKKNRKIF